MENITKIPNKMAAIDTGIDDEESGLVVSDRDLFIVKGIFNAILTQGFCILGSVTNIINIVVFYRIGFSKTINITLMSLSISDFGSCFMLIWRNLALNPWFQQIKNLPFETNEISYMISLWPHTMFVNTTKLLTAFISVERCLCVTMPLKVKAIITRNVIKFYCVFSYVLAILPFIPLFFTHKMDWKFSLLRNRTLYGLVVTENVAEVNDIVYAVSNIFHSQVPFFIITISTIFLVLSLRKNSKWRQTTTTSNAASKTSSKETRISKMIITICILFIACFLPFSVGLILQNVFEGMALGGRYHNAYLVMGAIMFFSECVNSACNIFIYYANNTVYKTTFDQIFRCQKNTTDVKQ